MKKQNVLLVIALALVLTLAFSVTAMAAFNDTGSHWAAKTIDKWAGEGLISGYPDGSFKPNGVITRAEFAAILNRVFQYTPQGASPFKDVAASAWYQKDVTALAEKGVLLGDGSGNFYPDRGITRQEAATILARAFKLTEDAGSAEKFSDLKDIAAWALGSVGAMSKAGYIKGYPDGTFKPLAYITRAEAITIIDNAETLVRSYLDAKQPDTPTKPDTPPAPVTPDKPSQPEVEPSTAPKLTNLDGQYAPAYDFSQATQLPMTGWFEKTIQVDGTDRTVKFYISDYASIRSYFTVIAVPNGVDTGEFLAEEGWFYQADKKAECLFVLEPADKKWSSFEDELAYVNAAIKWFKSPAPDAVPANSSGRTAFFSTFGENYLVGYGAGSSALEGWAVANPIFVTAQVYIDGQGLSSSYLNTEGAKVYTGGQAEGAGRDCAAEIYDMLNGDLIKRCEVPVPTWFAGYQGDASIEYWMDANEVSDQQESGSYWQKANATAWQTASINYILAEKDGWTKGISQVKLSAHTQKMDATDIYDFLSFYSRYDNTSAYGNQLALRLDYSDAVIKAQKQALAGKAIEKIGGFDVWGYAETEVPQNGATVISAVVAFANNTRDTDQGNDPRRFLLYIPESAKEADGEVPVVYTYAGNSQTDIIFLDSTQWWQVADEYGFIVAVPAETYSSQSVAVSHADNPQMYQVIMAGIKEWVDGEFADIDFSRVYCTGQSAGSSATHTLAQTYPEYFAAIATTTGGNISATAQYQPMPAYMIYGHCDANGTHTLFEGNPTNNSRTAGLLDAVNYYLGVDGLGKLSNYTDAGTAYAESDQWLYDTSRFVSNQFADEDGNPLVRVSRNNFRPHNCYPADMWQEWEFMSHYSYSVAPNGAITRYYSESAFAQNDEELILQQVSKGDIESIQAFTDISFYGQKLSKIVIQYSDTANLALADLNDYVLYDRTWFSPYFAAADLVDIIVDQNAHTVTLVNTQDTEAVSDRSRTTVGSVSTGNWYMDFAGNYYFGEGGVDPISGETYLPNTTRKAQYSRQGLDLVLCVNGEQFSTGFALSDGKGVYSDDEKWLPTDNGVYDDFDFLTVDVTALVDDQVTYGGGDYDETYVAPNYDQDILDGEVPVWVHLPENYDPNRAEGYPLVAYFCGSGVCYWQLKDDSGNVTATNLGCNLSYDNATTGWINEDAIVITPQVHTSTLQPSAYEGGIVLKWFCENYNVDEDKIILSGNSYGTQVSSDIIRQFPGLVDVFLCNNGRLGVGVMGANILNAGDSYEQSSLAAWTDQEIMDSIISSGLAIWFFNGAQDSAHPAVVQGIYKLTTADMLSYLAPLIGEDEAKAWIADNIRISAYQTPKFTYWGESDHSSTKVTNWFYLDAPYLDVVTGTDMTPGDTYSLEYPAEYATSYGAENFTYKVYGEGVIEWALSREAYQPVLTNLDGQPGPEYDFTQATQLPMTGWFEKTLPYSNRTVKFFISDNASVRSYFTIIAVPNGVDTTEFLAENDWFKLAAQKGECLYILEPANKQWGSFGDELAYVNAAISYFKAPAPDMTVGTGRTAFFSTFGENYLVGYGAGSPALEGWAVANPIFVTSQVYLGGTGLESTYLTTEGAKVYTGGREEGAGRDCAAEINTMLNGDLIKRSEVPVPTWFVDYDGANSVNYWKAANEVADTDVDGVFWQKADATAWQTASINYVLAEKDGWTTGISQVKISADADLDADAIDEFLSFYSRYDNTSAYGNQLALRPDYSDAVIAAQQQARDLTVKSTIGGFDVLGYGETEVEQTGATVISAVVSFANNSKDADQGNDARRFLLYIPESAKEADGEVPVVYTYAGNSQTDIIFLDSTQWWQVADEYGFIVAVPAETYSSQSVAVSHADNPQMYQVIMAGIEEWVDGEIADIDFSRIYCTGQSAGSSATHTLAQTYPEYFAAIATTTGGSISTASKSQPMPAYMVYGHCDSNGAYTLFEEGCTLQNVANYYLQVNGLKPLNLYTADETEFAESDQWLYDTSRFVSYQFVDENDNPLVRVSRNNYRPHNCYPADMWQEWDFMSHYSYSVAPNGDITRYYSESSFASNDQEEICDGQLLTNLDGQPGPEYDFTQATQLPMTGWFEKTIDVNGTDRTVKFYISDYASVRSYFTVIAVPNNVDTTAYLFTNGWFNLADDKGECLFVLEPADGQWGSFESELAYVNEAMNYCKSPKPDVNEGTGRTAFFSTFGEYYLVGFNEGCAALEGWAAANPILVTAQAYVGGTGLAAAYLNAEGAKEYTGSAAETGYREAAAEINAMLNGDLIKRCEVPVPTWFASYTGDASVSYWKAANEVADTDVDGVFWQKADATAWQTASINYVLAEKDGWTTGISQVKTSASNRLTAVQIDEFLSFYSRYDTTSAYGNQLALRPDYSDAVIAAQQQARDLTVKSTIGGFDVLGYGETEVEQTGAIVISAVVSFANNSKDADQGNDARRFLLYIPESAKEATGEVPVVYTYAGNSQTDIIFLDSTQWWQVADEYGFIVAVPAETYSSQSVAVSHADNPQMYQVIMAGIKEWVDGEFADIDFSRIYCTGQSAGSSATHTLAQTYPEYFAAIATTTGGNINAAATNDAMPAYMIYGHGDRNGAYTLFENNITKDTNFGGLVNAVNYYLRVNGIAAVGNFTAAETEYAESGQWLYDTERLTSYQFENAQGFPMVRVSRDSFRPHNCYPAEMWQEWEFMSHFSFEATPSGITRYYDGTEIDAPELTAEAYDGTPKEQLIDITLGNQLPVTGYYTQDVAVGNDTRTVKVYLPECTPMRTYFTIITVPDGYDTEDFLVQSGWLTLADKMQEGLYILEPGVGGWGSAADEYEYISKAIAAIEGKIFYSTHGLYYLAGYGTGGTALQEYAINTPLKVISAAFIDTEDLADGKVAAAGVKVFGDNPDSIYYDTVPYSQIPMPVWFVNEDISAVSELSNYLKDANHCLAASENTDYGITYYQDKDEDSWSTCYSDVKSQVSLLNADVDYEDPDFTAQVRSFLAYYTRYDNTSIYGNVLGVRLDYSSDNVDVNIMKVEETNGDVWTREYVIYQPDNCETLYPDGAPVVYVFAGGSQPNRLFLDATHWYEVADEYGFIVCVPCSQYSASPNSPLESRWNFDRTDVMNQGALVRERADDFNFVEKLIADVDAKYNTDPNRRFATGQSNGSMFSQNIALVMPQFFAAVGSTSATGNAFPDETTEVIPICLIFGENDNGNNAYDITNTEGSPYKSGVYWLNRNGAVAGINDATVLANVEDNIGMLSRQHFYTWVNADDVPVFKYGWTAGRSHNCAVDDMWTLWEAWFANWTKDDDGDRWYSPSGFVSDDAVELSKSL